MVQNYDIMGILHDSSKVVYTLLILYFGSEIGNWKLEIGNWKKYKDVDALPNFYGIFSISWGRLHFANLHWIPAFAGMTGIYIQTSFLRKPESRH